MIQWAVISLLIISRHLLLLCRIRRVMSAEAREMAGRLMVNSCQQSLCTYIHFFFILLFVLKSNIFIELVDCHKLVTLSNFGSVISILCFVNVNNIFLFTLERKTLKHLNSISDRSQSGREMFTDQSIK